MIVAFYAEKAFDKFQKPINDENTQKDRNRGKPPQVDKEHP